MRPFSADAAQRELLAQVADLVVLAARRGGLDGVSGVPGEPFRARVESVMRAAGAAVFTPLHVEHRLAVARRDEARRRRDACDAIALGSGWIAALRRFARWRIRRRIDAELDRESRRAAEAEALLPLEPAWVNELAARVITVYHEAAARGRAAAAVLGMSRDASRTASGIEDAVERALRQQLARAAGGAS
jgi:hypothetical protein